MDGERIVEGGDWEGGSEWEWEWEYSGLAAGAGHLKCPLPGAVALQQVEKLRMEMFRLALHRLCRGSDLPDLGSPS